MALIKAWTLPDLLGSDVVRKREEGGSWLEVILLFWGKSIPRYSSNSFLVCKFAVPSLPTGSGLTDTITEGSQVNLLHAHILYLIYWAGKSHIWLPLGPGHSAVIHLQYLSLVLSGFFFPRTASWPHLQASCQSPSGHETAKGCPVSGPPAPGGVFLQSKALLYHLTN